MKSCPVQHDAPPWRECLCYCNPCWLDHGGEWGDSGDDDDDIDIELSQKPPTKSMLHAENPLTAISHGDIRTLDDGDGGEKEPLPADYDALLEYERRFGEFDLAGGDPRPPPRSNAIQLSNDALFEAACARLELGDAENGSPRSLYTDFNLYVLTIRQCGGGETRRRHELIEGYEAARHKYRAHRLCADDARVAREALAVARRASRNNDADRLEHYRKAIFFTHCLSDKVALQQEYRLYCDALKRGR